MTQTQQARKAAEKAARDRLAGPLITAAGELGVAVAQRHTAASGVHAAQEQAREHIRLAQQHAEQIVADAHAQVTNADEQYRHAHTAALAAGWSAAALHDMGYTAPPTSTRRRPATSTTRAATDTADQPQPAGRGSGDARVA